MPTSVKDLLAAARAAVSPITPNDAQALLGREGALLLDVRDAPEVAATGRLKGALNVSRGMLEFRADADTPYHDPAFATERAVIVYCASGGRSALACKTLKDMGFARVHNLGGFKDAAAAGFEVEGA